MTTQIDVFRSALRKHLSDAEKSGGKYVDITSGALRRQVGGYPSTSYRMLECSRAMRDEVTIGDRIIARPPKGNGASLKIGFRLPRK